MPDILDELRAFKESDDFANGPDKTNLLTRAIVEIQRLRAKLGAISDLPDEDQARLDKAYATEERKR
jgi:hypothetical protein